MATSPISFSAGQFYQWGVNNPDLVEELGDGRALKAEHADRIAKLAELPAVDPVATATLEGWLLGMLQVRPAGLKPGGTPRTKEWLDKTYEFAKRSIK